IVSTIPGLLEDLGLLGAAGSVAVDAAVGAGALGSVEGRLVTLLGDGPTTVDEFVAHTGLPVATVLSALTLLEIRGLVVAAYGRYRARHLPAVGRPRKALRPTSRRPAG